MMNIKNIKIVFALLITGFLGYILAVKFHTFSDNNQHAESHQNNHSLMWTCSMDPQIMQKNPGSCPICGMDLVQAKASSDGLLPHEFKMSSNAMALAHVETIQVGTYQVKSNSLSLSGKIEINEKENIDLISYFSGRIQHLYVNSLGQQVRKGQLIATVYAPELIKAQQELLTVLSLKNKQPNLYNASRKKLQLLGVSEIEIQTIEHSNKVSPYFPIYSEVNGIVIEKLINEGGSIKDGQTILKVSNLESVWANFEVFESQLSLLKVGQKVTLTTNDNSLKWKGEIEFINPTLDFEKRVGSVRIKIKNEFKQWKPGMFVNASITINNTNKKERIMIPASSVLWTGKRSIVYLKTGTFPSLFKLHEVVLGAKIEESFEVLDGLTMNDEIVFNGVFTVDAAAQLQGKKSMMHP